MPTAFRFDLNGPYVEVDAESDLDYSVASWLEGLAFTAASWTITPNVANALHDHQLNAAPVELDGKTYQANEVSTMWINAAAGLQAGVTYEVRVRGDFTGGRKDDRTFRVVCRQR